MTRLVGVAIALFAASCYDPPMPACGFRCDYGATEVDGAQCPAGYFCNTDSRCHRSSPPHTGECPGEPGFEIDVTRPTVDLSLLFPHPDDPAFESSEIRFGFSERVEIGFGHVSVVDQDGNPLAGSVAPLGDREWMWFPDGGFQPMTRYQVTLSRDIADLAGNRMLEPFTYAFTVAFDGTPPRLLPLTLQQDGVRPVIELTFSEPVQFVGTGSSLRVEQLGRSYPFQLQQVTSRSFTLSLVEQLYNNVEYTVAVGAPIRDFSNNALVASSTLINPGDDLVGPYIISTFPPAGQVIGVATPVLIGFDENIASLPISVFLGSQPAEVALSFNTSTRVASISPRYQWLPLQTYVVEVDASLSDFVGNTLSTFPATFAFETGLDTVPPAPLTLVPDYGDEVPAPSAIRIEFTEQVTGVSSASFIVVGVSGVITDVDNGFTYEFVPDAPLPANSTIDVQLTSAIQDLSGNPLVPFSYFFTTAP